MPYQNQSAKIQKLLTVGERSRTKELERDLFCWKKRPMERVKRKNRIFARKSFHSQITAMIENYPNPRRKHCETGTFLNMLDYYGYQISEPMAFGIGSGIFFLYSPFLRMRGVTLPMLRIKPACIVKNFAERMHIGYHGTKYGCKENKAMHDLDELVEK